MNIKEIGNVFHCDCGFSWHRGKNGNHNCADGLREKVRQLASENVTLKNAITDHSHSVHFCEVCGKDDPCSTDDVCYALKDIPATDAYLAGIKANGRVEGAHFVANRMLAAWDAGFIEDTAKNAADIARMILISTEFMADAPEGDFDRSFSDGILEDIAQQLREGADK
ncbi:ead/Ea22-like family protein [Klebsiella pneumoniae]|uniref:ead/Ea22-like family protein n=1 Tax=Klebsiella pneumoniae TaxID=573 RepID=UPI000B26A9BA|nr:ead/Ea22-like family protein [Klebsiella pneumoniae]MDL4672918.1 ead/Ea22-like family protein [Klebsiella pneumoniae]MDL4680990.1 ead/Ea22-like family protein [Klebsiella pneumoniae]MDL4681039.1 ead/Ea22-like family protein [Klebsiella pneumoniae]